MVVVVTAHQHQKGHTVPKQVMMIATLITCGKLMYAGDVLSHKNHLKAGRSASI